jgi:signal transduction histidine kinase
VWRHLDGHPAHRQATLGLPAEDVVCCVDTLRMEQVFRNLLENALSTGAAAPRIDVAWSVEPWNDGPAIQIVVRDNGPGFSETQRQHAFEPFFTTKCSGTGLGLAITKRIVELHSGHIGIAPGIADGAAVVMHLPLRASAPLLKTASTNLLDNTTSARTA